ncbi:MAG: NUDIX domain-containing protein [Bacteroidia bacterium]|nr:NUDIX domain-containing protein [Bacteroidia bacterium]MCC7534046.1 NUDIX domain-containing protein [Bacteroidia bacterium]MCZ2141781.1 NUDIX domain-containing protein [Bacteroidia bacterium]
MNNVILPSQFTIRVYGLLIVDDLILISNEQIKDFRFTKFPGGGLEFGEGVADCLVREFKEETGLDITVDNHFYTSDFYQQSAFNKQDQLIAIYYLVSAANLGVLNLEKQIINTGRYVENIQLKWMKLSEINEAVFTFPIDKLIAQKLKEYYSQS